MSKRFFNTIRNVKFYVKRYNTSSCCISIYKNTFVGVSDSKIEERSVSRSVRLLGGWRAVRRGSIFRRTRIHLSTLPFNNITTRCKKSEASCKEPETCKLAVPPSPPEPCRIDSCKTQPRVIIVGAGLAGLSAAHRLISCGLHNFVVVEALDRPGGRIHSCWLGDAVGELGSMWINGASIANPVYTLAAQEGLLKEPLAFRRKPPVKHLAHLTSDGRAVEHFVTVPTTKMVKKVLAQASSLFSRNTKKNHGTLLQFLEARFKDELKAVPEEIRSDVYRVTYGMLNEVKTRWGARVCCISADMFGSTVLLPGKSLRVPIGLVGVLSPLLKGISPERITYCSPVKSISWPGCTPRATVCLCNGEILPADYVIVTIPLGVLKKHGESMFKPPLPDSKCEAIVKMGFGNVNRIILEYSKPFWAFGEGMMRLCWTKEELERGDNWMCGVAVVEDMPGTTNMLTTMIGGDEATMMEACTDEEVALEMTRLLRRFTGDPAVPFPSGIIRSKWASDIYFQGANSFMGLNATVADQCELASPLPGKKEAGAPIVLFAGEATLPGFFSSLAGARLSGIREADRVLNLTRKFNGPPPPNIPL